MILTKKSEQIAEIILERLQNDDYHGGVLPSLRDLALELGVNYLTVRQGLHLLCAQGVLEASEKRKFSVVAPPSPKNGLKVALLEGADGSSRFIRFFSSYFQPLGGVVRRFIYSYYNDELLTTVPDMNFDLIFFNVEPENLPPVVLAKFIACKDKLVSISFDYSRYGIRSILEPSVEESVRILFDLLEKNGHRKYDILCRQEMTDVIKRRVEAFQAAAGQADKKCNIHTFSEPSFLFDANEARKTAVSVFTKTKPKAVFVPNMPDAVGVMRGLFDIGYLAGRDYSLVSCGEIEVARNCIPSITTTTSEDFTGVIHEILSSDKDKLKFLLNPPQLFIGESLRLNKNQ